MSTSAIVKMAGKNWRSADGTNKHVDNHAVVFHPTDPDFLLVGCDGGLYRSYDRGKTYEYFPNLPLTPVLQGRRGQ